MPLERATAPSQPVSLGKLAFELFEIGTDRSDPSLIERTQQCLPLGVTDVGRTEEDAVALQEVCLADGTDVVELDLPEEFLHGR